MDRCVTLVESTSPSSLLMASLDAARRLAATRGRELVGETLAALARTREAIREIPGLDVLDERLAGAPGVFDYDPLRLAIDVRGTRMSGYEIARRLREDHDVLMELAGENVMVAVYGMGEDATASSARLLGGAARRDRVDQRGRARRRRRAVHGAAALGRAGDDAARGVPRAAGGGGGAGRRGPRRGRVARGLPARHPERAAGRAPDRARRSTTSSRRSRTAAACAGRATARCARSASWSSPSRTRSRRIACIRQWAPPPPSVNAASSGSYTVRPSARRRSFRSFDSALVSTRSPPRQTPFTPSLSASLSGTGTISTPFDSSQLHEPGAHLLDAHGGELLAEHRREHVDMEEMRRDALDAHLPAVRLEPAGELPRRGLLACAPRRCRSPPRRARRS